MASASEPSEFLFINKHENSISLSNSKADVASSIFRHIQRRQAQKIRIQKQEALRATSLAVERIRTLGWKSKNIEAVSNDRDQSPAGTEEPSSEDSSTEEGKKRIEDRRLIRWLCGEGEAVDPFHSTAMKVDSNSNFLIPFFTEWWNHTSWGWTWGRFQGSESVVAITVKRSLFNELHMLTLLTYASILRDMVQPDSVGIYKKQSILRKALVALQEQLRSSSAKTSDLLFDVSFLCLAAVFANEDDAATAHLKALRYLVDQAGGIQVVPAYLAELFLFSDYRLSLANLTRPVFDISDVLTNTPPESWTVNPTLAKAELVFLRDAVDSEVPPRFTKVAKDLMKCTQVLESVWAHPETLMNTYWMKWKCLTMVTVLLTLEPPMADIQDQPLKAETTRLALLLWVSILISTTLLQAGGLQFLPHFKDEALRGYEKPIHDALLRWNRALEDGIVIENGHEDTAFSEHRQVVREFEANGFVGLSSFMDTFFSLEQSHRGQRASKQERSRIAKAVEHRFKSAMGQNDLMFSWRKESKGQESLKL